MITKQIIKNPEKSYLLNLEDNFSLQSEQQVLLINEINFSTDYEITTYSYIDKYFDMDKTYLLKCSILRKDYEQNILIKLVSPNWNLKNDNNENQQLINYINLEIPAIEDETDISDSFSFVFKPHFNKLNKIIFQSLGNYNVSSSEKRIVKITDISIFEVNTKSVISDEQELSKIKEFGIQAPPGFLFSINGEGFHIGRTGMFYLSEENFIFESIGICDEKDPFIIDYKIKN